MELEALPTDVLRTVVVHCSALTLAALLENLSCGRDQWRGEPRVPSTT